MVAHPDILEQPDPLGRWVLASILLHVAVAAALMAHTLIHGTPFQLGDPHGGGFGAVTITPVASIPLPSRSGPVNPVANDTQSKLPTPPPQKKQPKPKVTAPEPDAIAIGKFNKRQAPVRESAPMNKYREKQTYSDNQLYSNAGQAANTAMLSRPGGGGVGLGTNSPFGTQFGYYASILQQTVARNWKTTGIDPRINAPIVKVTVTLLRDGSAAPGSVRVTQTSGIAPLDYSAQRAVLDSVPFPPLPQGFPRSQVDVEFSFQLRQ